MDHSLRNRNWSLLPDDIIRQIVKKLWVYPHYCRFAATCSDWYRITKKEYVPFQKNSVSLVLPYDIETDTSTFYQIHDSKTYKLNMPELHDKFVYGCSNGWLAVGHRNLKISLMNPITRQQIELPPLPGAMSFTQQKSTETDLRLHPSFICFIMSKLVIFGRPSSPKGCRVAIILSRYHKLYVCQSGDESWTDPLVLRVPSESWSVQIAMANVYCRFLHDVVFFHQQLYAINNKEEVVIFGFHGSSCKLKGLIKRPPRSEVDDPLEPIRVYLAVCSDNLLLIRKIAEVSDDRGSHKTCGFEMYELAGKNTWRRIYGLGENSLFLGLNGSICVSASEVPKYTPNCIYFADDIGLAHQNYIVQYGANNGVYFCNTSTVEMFNISHPEPCWSRPAVWCQQKIW